MNQIDNTEEFKCSICYDGDVDENGTDIQKFTLPCTHTFHTKCICQSLRRDSRCPICRDSGFSEEQKQTYQQINEDEAFFDSMTWKQRNSIRRKIINSAIRCLRQKLKDSKIPEYKHIKAWIRKYDANKTRSITLKKERSEIAAEYRKISKEYNSNPIVKKYQALRPWKNSHKIRSRENLIFRMFMQDLSYREMYGHSDIKYINRFIKNRYNVIKDQILTLPTR